MRKAQLTIETAKWPPKIPSGLIAFVSYSLLFIALDIISVTEWPFIIPKATVRVTGWCGSMLYVPGVIIFGRILLPVLRRRRAECSLLWLRYILVTLMCLEILRAGLEYFIFSYFNVGWNYYLSFSAWRLVVSGAVPMLWIAVWSSRSVKDYLTNVSGRGLGLSQNY